MHVLHAHWHFPTDPTEEGRMLFWVEDSELPAPRKQRGKRGKKAKPHPFCTAPEIAGQLLKQINPYFSQQQYKAITLFLPATKFGPQPSPQLVHDWDLDDGGEPMLFPWIVDGAWVSPREKKF